MEKMEKRGAGRVMGDEDHNLHGCLVLWLHFLFEEEDVHVLGYGHEPLCHAPEKRRLATPVGTEQTVAACGLEFGD